MILSVILPKSFSVAKDRTNTIPIDISAYVLPKFQTKQLSDLVPSQLLETTDTNWRLDSINGGLIQWWNLTSQVPATRGYSNHPLGTHQDWLYFLQTATRDVSSNLDKELVKNRALFLLDAFGVGYIENSQISYPEAILNDKALVNQHSEAGLFDWYQLSQNWVTPIIYPANSDPVLFIGSDKGYENFIRTIAMSNLNSKVLIPIKGPKNISDVTKEELTTFPAVVLYEYSGSDLEKLANYVENGGRLYIDTGSQTFEKKSRSRLLPVEYLEIKTAKGASWQLIETVEGIDTSKFSELSFKGGPWRITFAKNVRSWAQPILLFDNKPIITKGQLGKGVVIWSGFNFPFHIVDYNNFEEAKLFKNLLENIVNSNVTKTPEFIVKRPKPEFIEVEATENIKGVYFKENYHSGWQARVNETKLPVYKAELEFMYVPVQSEGKVTLEFKGNQTTWGLFWITIVSLATSIIYLFLAKPFNYLASIVFARLRKILLLKLNKRIKGWIEEE